MMINPWNFWIDYFKWKVNYRIKTLLSYRSVDAYLNLNGNNWVIEKADYPSWDKLTRFHYKVEIYRDFAYGTGLGKTAMQAAKRAVKRMKKDKEKFNYMKCLTDLTLAKKLTNATE